MKRYGFTFYRGGGKSDYRSSDIRGVVGGLGILLCVASILIGSAYEGGKGNSFYLFNSFNLLILFYLLALACEEFLRAGKLLILVLAISLLVFCLFLISNNFIFHLNFRVPAGFVSYRATEISNTYIVLVSIYLGLIVHVTKKVHHENS